MSSERFTRGFAEQSYWRRLNLLPFGALLFDLLENSGQPKPAFR